MDNFASDSVADVGSFFTFESLPTQISGVYSGANDGRQFANSAATVDRSIQGQYAQVSPGNPHGKPIPLISMNLQPPKGLLQRGISKKNVAGVTKDAQGPAIPVFEFTLNANEVVCFFGRNHFLSNFYQFPFEVDGFRYFNIEHYYEAVKLFTLLGPQVAVQLQNVKDPSAAKSVARRLLTENRVDRNAIEMFRRQEGSVVVLHALLKKFYPGSELARRLLDTGSALLAQTNPHDNLWAVNMNETEFLNWVKTKDKTVWRLPLEISSANVNSLPVLGKKGRNLLGFLLMEVRRKLKNHNAASAPIGTVPLSSKINEEGGGTEGNIAGGIPTAFNDQRCDDIGRQLAEMSVLQQRRL